MIGVDYASVDNNRVDIAKAKAAGMAFAVLRGAYGTWPDPTCKRDWAALGEAGIIRGAYLFQRFDAEGGSPADQAEAFCKAVKLEPGKDFPPALDVEFPSGRAAYGLSIAQAMAKIREAWLILRDHYKVTPMIYTSARVWAEDLGNTPAPDLAESPGWFAKPWPYGVRTKAQLDGMPGYSPKVPPPWGDQSNYFLYQYQGDAISYPGFSNTVDINRFHTAIIGMAGDQIRWIERRLGQAHCADAVIPTTGVFNEALKQKIIEFQGANGLTPDGIVGPRTFAMLAWKGYQSPTV